MIRRILSFVRTPFVEEYWRRRTLRLTPDQVHKLAALVNATPSPRGWWEKIEGGTTCLSGNPASVMRQIARGQLSERGDLELRRWERYCGEEVGDPWGLGEVEMED